jgi:hypothetical protein
MRIFSNGVSSITTDADFSCGLYAARCHTLFYSAAGVTNLVGPAGLPSDIVVRMNREMVHEGAARDLERRSEDGRTRTTVIVRIAATEAHAPTTRRVTRGVA